MSEPVASEQSSPAHNAGDDDAMLFAQMVLQQTNMALMLLGKMQHPESGEVVQDIGAAKLFIDQLAMLEAKTKGNLTKQEADLLKQNLMALRLAFVEAVDSPGAAKPSEPTPPAPPPASSPPPDSASGEESRKKFSKKY
jgi:Domain of unknown function (DUF1844)